MEGTDLETFTVVDIDLLTVIKFPNPPPLSNSVFLQCNYLLALIRIISTQTFDLIFFQMLPLSLKIKCCYPKKSMPFSLIIFNVMTYMRNLTTSENFHDGILSRTYQPEYKLF